MSRKEFGSRVVVGIVVGRSSTEPAKSADLSYSIEIDDDGYLVQYDNVKPGKGWRPTDTDGVDPEILFMPFLEGQRLPIGIEPAGSVDTITILAREHIDILPCDESGDTP